MKHLSLTQALSEAVERCRREVFVESLAADFASLSATERLEEHTESEAWDTTSSDGLENS